MNIGNTTKNTIRLGFSFVINEPLDEFKPIIRESIHFNVKNSIFNLLNVIDNEYR